MQMRSSARVGCDAQPDIPAANHPVSASSVRMRKSPIRDASSERMTRDNRETPGPAGRPQPADEAMAEADQVSELVGNIYDASVDPTSWPHVLELTCGYIQGIAAVLVAHEKTAGPGAFYFTWGDDPCYTESYNRTFSKINPLLVPTFAQSTPGDILAVGDLMPYDEYFASRFYKEWAATQGYLDTIHLILEKSANGFASVAVARHERDGLVDDDTRRRVRLLG